MRDLFAKGMNSAIGGGERSALIAELFETWVQWGRLVSRKCIRDPSPCGSPARCRQEKPANAN